MVMMMIDDDDDEYTRFNRRLTNLHRPLAKIDQ